MKLLILAFCLCGCTVTVKPLTTQTKYYRHSNHVVTASKFTTVDSDWMDHYKKMEKQNHYVVPGDSKIESVGEKFKVPQTVVDHYSDMLKADSKPENSLD